MTIVFKFIYMNWVLKKVSRLERMIKHVGYSPVLNSHEKRKLGIFNLMNVFLGFTLGILIPFLNWLSSDHISAARWWIPCGPLIISIIALLGNHFHRYEASGMCFFTLHTLLLAGIYALKMDIGTDLFFICFGVLSVFFLRNVYNIIFSFCLSMTCYFLVHGFSKDHEYSLEASNYDLYLLNRLLAIFFIFYGIFLIRNENERYALQITNKNWQLRRSHGKISAQKMELAERATLMEAQANQLTELNSLKNRLFSVVAHDLRGPLHALHHLFRNMERYDIPGDKIKILLPEVVDDLSRTAIHIENLLQWAKSQMHSEAIKPQVFELSKIVSEVLAFLRLQTDAKQLHIKSRMDRPVHVFADEEMVKLVLRNLLSNAIKFTPEGGVITLDAMEGERDIEVSVEDTGAGISPDNLKNLAEGMHYTTLGTEDELGTGLGLMLCKEFLSRNGGRLAVRSKPGIGSIFSLFLPKAPDNI